MNYYNEFDPFAAAWLGELIKAKLIPNGHVDTRSIADVRPEDLNGYTQCHFFAGIGGWSLALQLAGWPTDRPVWTGSCPCQPFSSAGKQKGKSDERHLWPVWFNLIRECRPSTVFGEQVSSAIAHGWLDDVFEGLEQEGYACGAAVLPACGVGAPHKRDRLWFVADSAGEGLERAAGQSVQGGGARPTEHGVMGHSKHNGPHGGQKQRSNGQAVCDNAQGQNSAGEFTGAGEPSHVADASVKGLEGRALLSECPDKQPSGSRGMGAWSSGVWIDCPDGKQRLVEPSIPLLANGVSNRVGKLRGYGNAIVPAVGAAFIEAFLEVENEQML